MLINELMGRSPGEVIRTVEKMKPRVVKVDKSSRGGSGAPSKTGSSKPSSKDNREEMPKDGTGMAASSGEGNEDKSQSQPETIKEVVKEMGSSVNDSIDLDSAIQRQATHT